MTSVRARYFPCAVHVPGETRPRRKAFALLAEGGERGGLHVWSKPGDSADVHLSVDWQRTKLPASERQARTGVEVWLTDGTLVMLTPGPGCRCGALGRWPGPPWASSTAVRT